MMEKEIAYRFEKMQLEQFAMFLENYSPGMKNIAYSTETKFSFDKLQNVICSTISINMSCADKPLAKIVLSSFFKIKTESADVLTNDSRIIFPPSILVQFASLCYGSLRGVLFAKTAGTPLNNYILPPVHFNSIIDRPFTADV